MDKREAKRRACGMVAAIIDQRLSIDDYPVIDPAMQADHDRIWQAIRELRDEMYRRAAGD